MIETDKMPKVTALFLEGVHHQKHSFILFVCLSRWLDVETIELKGPALCKNPLLAKFSRSSIIYKQTANK